MQKRILPIFYLSLIFTVFKLCCPAHLFPNTPRTVERGNIEQVINFKVKLKILRDVLMAVDPDPEPDPDPYLIRIQLGLWIRIRIRIRNPDPDPGGQK